jgi:hypothetical protein
MATSPLRRAQRGLHLLRRESAGEEVGDPSGVPASMSNSVISIASSTLIVGTPLLQ